MAAWFSMPMNNHQKSAAPYRSFMPFLACLMGTIRAPCLVFDYARPD
jgi:hypothetical protein